MEITELLPKLTIHQKTAANKMVEFIGFDKFIKSSLFRTVKTGTKEQVFEQIDKWAKKIPEKNREEIKTLWQKLG
jgi:GH24 family phage-related lysozyme (muramidase)